MEVVEPDEFGTVGGGAEQADLKIRRFTGHQGAEFIFRNAAPLFLTFGAFAGEGVFSHARGAGEVEGVARGFLGG